MTTQTLFCSPCGQDQSHELEVDRNQEILARCPVCAGFLKFPAPESVEQLQGWIGDHKAQNEPIVVREKEAIRLRKASEDALAALDAIIAPPNEEPAPPP